MGGARFAVKDLVVEQAVEASRARVWRTLTRGIGTWWPEGFWSLRGSRRMVLEPRLGGRLYEDAGGGQGLVWYHVTGLVRDEWLLLSGEMAESHGGPCRNILSIRLETSGARTVVRLRETLFGRVAARTPGSMRGGWRTILARLRERAEE
jgi:uncharacterized protein YndB with AHSA1/START domain